MTINLLAFPRENIDIENILNINETDRTKTENSNELIQN